MAPMLEVDSKPQPIKKQRWEDEFLEFLRKDKEGTIQPHEDAQ